MNGFASSKSAKSLTDTSRSPVTSPHKRLRFQLVAGCCILVQQPQVALEDRRSIQLSPSARIYILACLSVSDTGLRSTLVFVRCVCSQELCACRNKQLRQMRSKPVRPAGQPPPCGATPTHECRKARAAIQRGDFRPRVRVVSNQLGCFVPCDRCRIELPPSRRGSDRV